MLATNQGLLYVLSMVVIGGMVGGGSLGFDRRLGLPPAASYFGKGLAAGVAIAALGIMLDRITRYAARSGRAMQLPPDTRQLLRGSRGVRQKG